MDCCCASAAIDTGRKEAYRTLELLSTWYRNTRLEGCFQESFTGALCESLQELLQEPQSEMLSVTRLWQYLHAKKNPQAAAIWDHVKRYRKRYEPGLQSTQSENTLATALLPSVVRSPLLIRSPLSQSIPSRYLKLQVTADENEVTQGRK